MRVIMRSNQSCAVIPVCKSHVCAPHARAGFRSARGARERAIYEPLRRRNVDGAFKSTFSPSQQLANPHVR
eukprot:9707740-Lingulodinium_polyedra.AAC.1